MSSQTLHIAVQLHTVIRILLLGFLGFLVSTLVTPIYTTLAYKYEWWKRPRSNAVTGEAATVFNSLHAAKHRRHIPTMAGLVFVISVAVVTLLANLTRLDTWLPLTAFAGAGTIGLIDDIINIRGNGLGVAGLPSKLKLLLITLIALVGGWWFYSKLGVHAIHIPLASTPLHVGWLIVPIFILVVVATANAVNITDGLDGLAGGLATSAFSVYSIIAFLEGRYGIAAFCLTIVGALLSYTWFNIFPARFFMGDIGSFALGTALGVVAMLTDTVLLLPIIGIVFVAEAGSSVLQIASKKLRNGKKIFRVAPLHHHFEAEGWPEAKVTMLFLGDRAGGCRAWPNDIFARKVSIAYMDISNRSRRPSGFGSLRQRRHKPDYWLVILSVIMLVIGLIVVYAISPALSAQQNVGDNYYINKQLIAVVLGVIGFIAVANLPISWWRKIERPLIIGSVLAALIVRLFGDQVNGAYRWIQVGGFSFQAVELIKLALLVGIAGFLSDRIKNNELTNSAKTFKPILIVLGIVAFVVGIVQKDLGSTGVMVAMMIAMSYIAGLPIKRIAVVAASLAVAVVILVLPFSYRRDRLITFLHPAQDCLNTGYQSCQALITVGSGGVFGKGLGKGVQAYGYLPEAANDSIFAIFAEKFGFVGVSVLLGLFVGFFSRLKRIIERAPDNYSRLLVTGILAWLSTQTVINIGAMIGLLPLKGITLPFISYGGTSVLFVTIAIGICFQISHYTTYSEQTDRDQLTETDDVGYGSRKVAYRSQSN